MTETATLQLKINPKHEFPAGRRGVIRLPRGRTEGEIKRWKNGHMYR